MKPLQLILGSVRFVVRDQNSLILGLWFLASLVYINNCPTRCNTKQVYLLFGNFILHSTLYTIATHIPNNVLVHNTICCHNTLLI